MFFEVLQERLHREGRFRYQSEMKPPRVLFVIPRNISQIKYHRQPSRIGDLLWSWLSNNGSCSVPFCD